MIGDEQAGGAVDADQFLGAGVSLPVRLEITRFLDRNDPVEGEADVRTGGFQHVGIAVRENHQLVAGEAQAVQRADDVGKRLQRLDAGDQMTDLVLGVAEAATIHHVRHGAVADLPVGRVAAIAQGVDHRVFIVGAPPPGDETVGAALPAFGAQEWLRQFGKAFLHVDDGAVLVEHQSADFTAENFGTFHGVALVWCEVPG